MKVWSEPTVVWSEEPPADIQHGDIYLALRDDDRVQAIGFTIDGDEEPLGTPTYISDCPQTVDRLSCSRKWGPLVYRHKVFEAIS